MIFAMPDDPNNPAPNNKSGGLHDLVKAESMLQLALALMDEHDLVALGDKPLQDRPFLHGIR